MQCECDGCVSILCYVKKPEFEYDQENKVQYEQT